MSNNESFIDEVTEEVRRDRLYATLRRWGWVGVLAVLVIVGGAAWNEVSKARERAEAEALGDAVYAALDGEAGDRAAALAAIEADGNAAAVLALLRAAELEEAGDPAAAAAALDGIAGMEGVDPIYGQLARLKAAMLSTAPAEERIAALEPLSMPGAPFRLIALEQIALAEIGRGDTEAGIARYREILEAAGVSRGLRERAQSMIVALGADLGDGAVDSQ